MVGLKCGAARHDYEIDPAEGLLPQPETFPDEALDAVAVGGFADLSFGNRQPEARIRFAVGSREHGQPAVRGLQWIIENPLEIGCRIQSAGLGKTMAVALQALHGQPLAALGPAGIDHGAATARLHAGAEAVGAHALDLAGLPSSFHGSATCCLRGKKTRNPNAPPKALSMLWISRTPRYSIAH